MITTFQGIGDINELRIKHTDSYYQSVETTETSEEPISHELTNPPEAIHEEVVETTEIKETEQLEHFEHQEESPSASASSRSSPTPSTKSSSSSSSPVSSSEEINDDVHSDEESNPIKIR